MPVSNALPQPVIFSVTRHIPRRICIYSKDVSNITKSERRALLSRIRTTLGKARGDLVTVHDVCQATRLRPEDVEQLLLN